MPTMFNARDAGNYEKLMGRWSRRLAPLFIEHAGVAPGEHVLEIGCGTGSLTFALAEAAAFETLTAIDHSEIYLAAAHAKTAIPASAWSKAMAVHCAFPTPASTAHCRCWCCLRCCQNPS